MVARCEQGRGCPPFPLLADSLLSAASIPESQSVVFVFITHEELKALANRHHVVWYHYLSKVQLLGDSAEVVFGRTLVVGVTSPTVLDGGSSTCRWVFRRVGSEWIVVPPTWCLTA
jgi:hypothetical protein